MFNFIKAFKMVVVFCLPVLVLVTVGFTMKNLQNIEVYGAEYSQNGITITNDIYYYDGVRIRVFMDMRADNSFETAFLDELGDIDIRLIRNPSGEIIKTELIGEEEAQEIIDDFNGVDSSVDSALTSDGSSTLLDEKSKDKDGESEDIIRLEILEAPDKVQEAIHLSCTENGFYIIKHEDSQYVYYNNLIGNYAYQLSDSTINIIDLLRLPKCAVLLSLPANFDIGISYNSNAVTYTMIAS